MTGGSVNACKEQTRFFPSVLPEVIDGQYNETMSQRELKSLLSTLLPYLHEKQATTLFTVVLLLGLHGTFDTPHVHVEPAPLVPTVMMMVAASGTNINMAQMRPSSVRLGP